MTVKELARAATIDAPAATVAVNDLEERGLVVRETDPTNRRSKVVSLTDAGRAMVRKIDAIDDPAPDVLAALDETELKALQAILAKLAVALQHRHRGVVPADARHRAAAARTRAAQQDPIVCGRHAPAPRRCVERFVVLDERPDSAPWKMLPAVMPSVALQVERGLGLDAQPARRPPSARPEWVRPEPNSAN